MLIVNARTQCTSYLAEFQLIMCMQSAQESCRWLAPWTKIAHSAASLYGLLDMARTLQVVRFSVKDESARSQLSSFKAL